jgi:hypothetical protein
MPVSTRSTSCSPVKKSNPANTRTQQQDDPKDAVKIFLLPANLTDDARILNLRHPRDLLSRKFLFCPSNGLYEMTRVSHAPSEYRSMILAPTAPEDGRKITREEQDALAGSGKITKEAQLFVATPFDLMFILLSILPSVLLGTAKPLFQPLDDLFENILPEDRHLQYIINQGRSIVESKMTELCDSVDAADEVMFRVNERKFYTAIQKKVEQMIATGLPLSLEERFVTRALEKPILSIKREESTTTTQTTTSTGDADADTPGEGFDSQSTAVSSAPSMVFSDASHTTSVTTVAADIAEPSLIDLQRKKVALDFITSSYMTTDIASKVTSHFAGSDSPIDFRPLVEHMAELAKLRAEAAASRSFGDFSRKRGLDEEEAAQERKEKKQKQEEDEKKRKAGTSRGVKELAKVNVSGMKKMSDFFSKKPTATKAKS